MEKFIGKIDNEKLLSILENLGIEVEGETSQDFIAYCPFHHNKDTAAFNIGKKFPYPFRCWNPSCGDSGNLLKLVQNINGFSSIEALRYLYKFRGKPIDTIDKLLIKVKEEKYEIWEESILRKTLRDYDDSIFDILYERGFIKETLKYFEVGFSEKQKRITIPVRDEFENFVGFTGRATESWQNRKYLDKGLPKRFILFNLNNAKKFNLCIVVEGPLDALKVHQAGFPNVVAILGGGFTREQAQKLIRYFQSVIIFTDSDNPGRDFANKISGVMKRAGKQVNMVIYPNGKKDPGEMTEDEIKYCINNSVSLLEYTIHEMGIGE